MEIPTRGAVDKGPPGPRSERYETQDMITMKKKDPRPCHSRLFPTRSNSPLP